MATAVKIFSHKGIVTAKRVGSEQLGTDSLLLLKQPYLAAEAISATASAASSSANTAPSGTTLLRIEVADGGTIRYEVNSDGRAVTATQDSPAMSGVEILEFGVGWTLSVIEA